MATDPKEPQRSPDFPDAFYRVSVKGLLVRDDKLLMVEDVATEKALAADGLWELPGGGLDFGESFQEALWRELLEEMNLKVTFVAPHPTYMWTAKRLDARGMDWYYVVIPAFKIEVESLDFSPSEECRSITFVSKEELLDLHGKGKVNDQIIPLVDLFNPEDFKK